MKISLHSIFFLFTLGIVCSHQAMDDNNNQKSKIDYENEENNLLKKAETLEYMRNLGCSKQDLENKTLIEYYKNQALETEKWNKLQESAIKEFRDNELHDNQATETQQLIKVIETNTLSDDEKIEEIKKLCALGVNVYNHKLLAKIFALKNDHLYVFATSTLFPRLNEQDILFFLDHTLLKEKEHTEKIALLYKKKLRKAYFITDNVQKVTFLLDYHKEFYETYKKFQKTLQPDTRLELLDHTKKFLIIPITQHTQKLITDTINSLKYNKEHYNAIKQILSMLVAYDFKIDNLDFTVCIMQTNFIHPIFVWYFDQTQYPTLEDFELLLKLDPTTFKKNKYGRILEHYMKNRPIQTEDNKEQYIELLCSAFARRVYKLPAHQQVDIYFTSQKWDVNLARNLIAIMIHTKELIYHPIGSAACFVPYFIPKINSSLFKDQNLNNISTYLKTIGNEELKKFAYAGYFSQLHKIGTTKQGIGCAITESKDPNKPIKVSLKPTLFKTNQIGYEPAQLILQYAGPDLLIKTPKPPIQFIDEFHLHGLPHHCK